MKQEESGKFILFVCVIFLLFFFCTPAHAKRSVVLTYDISQSMYSLKNEAIFSLSAKEFQKLSSLVRYLIFEGDPSHNPNFSQLRNGRFIEKTFSQNCNWEGRFWREGDDLIYYEYAHNLKLKYDSRSVTGISGDEISRALVDLIPYPRGVDPDSRKKTNENVKKFEAAFPGWISLQQYAELSAYKIFDEMVNIGFQNEAEVVWIQVSDMDMDHSTRPEYKKKSNDLEKELTVLKNNKYKDCMDHVVYKAKVADRIWITVTVITYLNLEDLTRKQIETQKKLDDAMEKIKAQKDTLAQKEKRLMQTENELKQTEDELKQTEDELKQTEDELKRIREQNSAGLTALSIEIAKNRYEGSTIGADIRFERKKIEKNAPANRVFQYTPVQICPVENQADNNFRLNRVMFELREPQSMGFGLIKTVDITPVPRINTPFSITIAMDEGLMGKSFSGSFQVAYDHFIANKSNAIGLKKTWNVEKIYIPSPKSTERFWWLIPVVLFGLILVFVAKQVFEAKQPRNSGRREESERPSVDEDKEDGYDRPWDEEDEFEFTGDSETGREASDLRVTLRCEGATDLTLEDGDRAVVLSGEDRLPYQQAWELACRDQEIEWSNGQLYVNGSEVTEDQISVENEHGEQITIYITRS